MRKWIGLAVFLSALMWQLGSAAAQTQLKVMVFPGIQNLPFFVAEEKGFFAKRGLAVEVLFAPNSTELRDGLAQNRHQIAHAGSDNAVALAELGKADVAIVMGGDNGWNRLFVQPEISSLAELRSKTVIVDAPNTSYALLLYKMLAMAGLKKGDYEVKAIGSTFTRLQELQKEKSYAASMLNPPFSLQAVRAGLKDMGAVVDTVGPYQATAGFVMRGWAKDNADVLVRYIQAQLDSLRWIYDPSNKGGSNRLACRQVEAAARCGCADFRHRDGSRNGLREGCGNRYCGIQQRPETPGRDRGPMGRNAAFTGEISGFELPRAGTRGFVRHCQSNIRPEQRIIMRH